MNTVADQLVHSHDHFFFRRYKRMTMYADLLKRAQEAMARDAESMDFLWRRKIWNKIEHALAKRKISITLSHESEDNIRDIVVIGRWNNIPIKGRVRVRGAYGMSEMLFSPPRMILQMHLMEYTTHDGYALVVSASDKCVVVKDRLLKTLIDAKENK